MMVDSDQAWLQAVQLHLQVLELRAVLNRAVATFSPEGGQTQPAPPPPGNEDWKAAYA